MRDRVITASVLAPIVLATLFLSNPWPLACLGFLAWFLSVSECDALLANQAKVRPVTYLGFPIGSLWVLFHVSDFITALIMAVLVLTGLGCVYLTASEKIRNLIVGDLASLWYAIPLVACLVLHNRGISGGLWSFKSPLLLALLPVWAGDIAGIFAGRAFGKHLLAPKLSPKKTVEGAIANLLAASIAGAVFGPLIGLSLATSIGCGGVAGFVGQLGDLFESYVKRRAGKKDSGSILPGHGGILDRIDSLLFTAPAVALLLACFR